MTSRARRSRPDRFTAAAGARRSGRTAQAVPPRGSSTSRRRPARRAAIGDGAEPQVREARLAADVGVRIVEAADDPFGDDDRRSSSGLSFAIQASSRASKFSRRQKLEVLRRPGMRRSRTCRDHIRVRQPCRWRRDDRTAVRSVRKGSDSGAGGDEHRARVTLRSRLTTPTRVPPISTGQPPRTTTHLRPGRGVVAIIRLPRQGQQRASRIRSTGLDQREQSTATAKASHTWRIRASLNRPSRSTRTPSETLSTESRLIADRRGTGSSPGSSTTSLTSPRMVVVHGAINARLCRGITASRESTTTGRRPISAISHHQTSPRAGSAVTTRQRLAGTRRGHPTRPAHRVGVRRRRHSWRPLPRRGVGQAMPRAPRR